MKTKLLGAALAAGLVLGVATSASAGICNVTIDTAWTPAGSPTTGSVTSDVNFDACNTTSTMSGNVQSGGGADAFNINVFATGNETLEFTADSTDNSNGGIAQLPGFTLVLSNIEWLGMTGDIIGVIDNSPNINVMSFTADTITFTMAGFGNSVSTGSNLAYNLGTFDLQSTHVPEPGTLALFGLGLAGLGFARRRKAA